MNYRHAEIMPSEDLGASGTEIVDINIVDPISRITVRHEPVGGSDTPIAHPIKNIEKLELVDGSDVLYSLSGYEGQGLNVLEAKKPEMIHSSLRNGGTPLMYIHMDFGRWLWDPELAFDPKKFTNPQIKLTWNQANYDESCDSHSFMMYAHTFDEKAISPIGFLMNKELKSFEPSSGAYEYTDLPTDFPLRKLILKGLKAGASVRGLIEDIKLSEDNDKRIPIDGDIWQMRSFLDIMGGDVVEVILVNAPTAGKYIYTVPTNILAASVVNETAANALQLGALDGGRAYVMAATADCAARVTIRGKNPHGCICIPFGIQDDIADWYDVTKLGSLRLRLKGGTSSAAGDEVDIVTQQLRRY